MKSQWFRPDVEGLRGVAIGLVLLAHAGFTFAGGGFIGIDVFFVISGFLITALLLRELEGRGRISLSAFYARRIRRLLPAAALVLLVVVVLSELVFTAVRNEQVSGEVLASIFYFINWELASQSVDYFAQGFEASPVQHFWSLAVEEQFYLVWPVTMVALAALAARLGWGLRRVLGAAVVLLGLASLAYSGYFTAESPTQAYFSTFTRAWELALGAFLAVARLPRPGPRTAGLLAWAGAAAVIGAFIALGESTPYPGLVGVVPALGVAAFILAGGGKGAPSLPMRALGSAPMQYLGRLSYSLYLWHWPALIFVAGAFGAFSPWVGALVIAASWAPAALTYRYLEQPIRRSQFLTVRPRRAFYVLGAGSGAAALAAVALATLQPSVPLAPKQEVEGAMALKGSLSVQRSATALRPDATVAFEDRTPLMDDDCFAQFDEVAQPECAYGDVDSDTTVVLFGDSHGEQYFPALELLAEREGWRLVALTKSFCSPARIEQNHPYRDGPFTDCMQWREQTSRRILAQEEPDLIVVGGSTSVDPAAGGEELAGAAARQAMVSGFASTLSALQRTGARTALVTDVPRSPIDIPECVSENHRRLQECSFPAPERGPIIERTAVARVDGVELVNTVPAVCAAERCRGVIGDAIVYRDRGHLTATFAATLAPVVRRELANRGRAALRRDPAGAKPSRSSHRAPRRGADPPPAAKATPKADRTDA